MLHTCVSRRRRVGRTSAAGRSTSAPRAGREQTLLIISVEVKDVALEDVAVIVAGAAVFAVVVMAMSGSGSASGSPPKHHAH